MNAGYDNVDDPLLSEKFYNEGKVIFLLSKKETSLLKSITQHETKLEVFSRRPGWINRIYVKYLVFNGILKTFFLSIYSSKATGIFDFFAINKSNIRNIHEQSNKGGSVTVTFYRK